MSRDDRVRETDSGTIEARIYAGGVNDSDICTSRSRRAGKPMNHLWTSSRSVNGGPKIAMCSWCGRLADDTA